MSTTTEQDGRQDDKQDTLKETERVVAGPGPGRGPMGGGMVGGKANTFGPSLRRMAARMAPYRIKTIAVLVLTVVSVAANAVGPWVLGRATDLIFYGRARRRPAARYGDQATATSCPDRAWTSTQSPRC